jgi:hypothetical protein
MFDFRQGQKILLFSITSRPAVGPIQLPTEWVPGAVSPGSTRQGREADYSPPSSTQVKNGGNITPIPHTSSWCGA